MTSILESKKLFSVVQVPIQEQQIASLLCSAFEGGSTYWVGIKRYEQPPGKDLGTECPYIEAVMAGGKLFLYDQEDPKERWVLTKEKLIKGLEVFATLEEGKGRHHWFDFLVEDDDSITADVYLQCCLFGEIVFG